MAVTHEQLMALRIPERQYSYTDNDTMLYAVGIGLGADPLDREQLAFVYEKKLKVMPSMATVIAWDDSWVIKSGLDFLKVVHGEQRLTLHKPLPAAATVKSSIRVKAAYDKGPGKGALLVGEIAITDAASGDKLCTLESVTFARGDGGFGGPAGSPEPLPRVPERAPDRSVAFRTLPQAALIYRLSGDRNPLHCDPDVARAAGFDRPILHGLCTWGHACHAVVRECCDYRPERITSFAARFTAPVYPGETIETEMWREGAAVHFRSRVPERDVTVLNNGYVTLAP